MNTFGKNFRLSIFGESHGVAVGVVVDGVKPGIPLSPDDFMHDIARRKPGALGTTARAELDMPEILSGVFRGFTTGAPLTLVFRNADVQSEPYEQFSELPRPSHADFVANRKFGGYNDYRGGGHFSGRLTLPLVAAGVVAKKMVEPIDIKSRVVLVGGSADVEQVLERTIADADSVGGVVECIAINLPIGLGEPFFDPLESIIAHLAFAIPGVRGIEFGAGFAAAAMQGSQHNDPLIDLNGTTATNHAGGVVGGISNGNPLVFRVAVKPTASIGRAQETINLKSGRKQTIEIKGRHDACIALRVPVVLEAITAIALAEMSRGWLNG